MRLATWILLFTAIANSLIETFARKKRSFLKLENLLTSQDFLNKFIGYGDSSSRQYCRHKFFKQIISHPGCTSKTIINKLCYGMCKSAYVPEVADDESRVRSASKPSSKSSPGTVCIQCQPMSSLWMSVVLDCPNGKKQKVFKKVRKVRKCHCWSKGMPVPVIRVPRRKDLMKFMILFRTKIRK